jgi:uncharacterized DUF497 family protein
MRLFGWHENKRLRHLARRRIDFVDADRVFDGRPVITTLSGYADETPFVSTAALDDGKFYSMIWTWRGARRPVISFRRARYGEEREHRQLYG